MESFNFYLQQLDNTTIALLSCLFIVFCIQIYYWTISYKRPLRYAKKKEGEEIYQPYAPSVSVIIVTQEDYENLKKSLPAILNQKYSDFEVIVVNVGFTERTNNLIQEYKLQHTNLYDTFVPYEPLEQKNDRKKLALTVGIKAAKNEVLLFTEADSIPDSDNWIGSMMKSMGRGKDIVIGHCYYNKSKSFINLVARFDNLIYNVQFLSSALAGKPYTGLYRNLAYRKDMFFDNKGFSSSLKFEHSEGIFLNQMMNKDNVSVALDQDSFVSAELNSFSKWEVIRVYSYKIKRCFSNFRLQRNQFIIEVLSRYMFYPLFIILLLSNIITENWLVVAATALIFLIKLPIQTVSIYKLSKYFKAGKLQYIFLILELMQPLYNFEFKLLSRKKRSKL